MGQSIQKWTTEILWKTAFKAFFPNGNMGTKMITEWLQLWYSDVHEILHIQLKSKLILFLVRSTLNTAFLVHLKSNSNEGDCEA